MTTPTQYAPCAPWIEADDVELCKAEDFTAGMFVEAIDAATALLFVKTGRQFPGVCTDTWRPCGLGACGCADWAGCACARYPAVKLRHQPVIEIESVHVDGVELPDTAYMLGQDRDFGGLLRVDGEQWPCCQDLALAITEPDTWQIVYTWGVEPPPGGPMAAQLLACELATGWKTGRCRLPRRVSTITRENFTAVVLDNFELFQEGLTGIAEVDLWLSTFNPSGSDRAPKVINVDGLATPDVAAARARHVQSAASDLMTGPYPWWQR